MLKQKRDLIDRRIVIASLTDSGRGTLKKTDEYQKKGNGEDIDEPQSRGDE
jgi:DNA-binding MarR family transcriptional regulator